MRLSAGVAAVIIWGVLVPAAPATSVVAGPARAGHSVFWGEKLPNGALAVQRRTDGGRPQLVRRIATPREPAQQRAFGGSPGALSASVHWLAYTLERSKQEHHGDVGIVTTLDLSVRVQKRGGRARDPLPGCGPASWIATAARGRNLVIAQSDARCDGRPGTRVWLLRAGEPMSLIHVTGGRHEIREIHVAGGRVAWLESVDAEREQIIVADLVTGSEIERLGPEDFSGHTLHGFDLDARGHVAALSGPQPACMYACVDVRRVGSTGPATRISARASDTALAIGHGRVAWVGVRGDSSRRIVVADLAGNVVQRLDHFGSRWTPVGDLSITGRTLVWAKQHAGPDLRGRVRARRLR